MDLKHNMQPTPQPEPTPSGPARQQYVPPHHRGRGMLVKLIFAVITLLILAAIAVGVWMSVGANSNNYAGIKSNQYQAVFLTNGQVYFGKLSDNNEAQAKLTNIYYLQVQQKVQPAEPPAEGENEDKNNEISLAKLGQELHGPEDTMFLSKDQILFWENLKDDSKVVQAIKSAQ